MSRFRWTEFPLTICRGAEASAETSKSAGRRTGKTARARLSLRGQFVERWPQEGEAEGNPERCLLVPRSERTREIKKGEGRFARALETRVVAKGGRDLNSDNVSSLRVCTARSVDSVANRPATITTAITLHEDPEDGIPGRARGLESPDFKCLPARRIIRRVASIISRDVSLRDPFSPYDQRSIRLRAERPTEASRAYAFVHREISADGGFIRRIKSTPRRTHRSYRCCRLLMSNRRDFRIGESRYAGIRVDMTRRNDAVARCY